MHSNVQQQNAKNEFLITTSDYLLDTNRPESRGTAISIFKGNNDIEIIHTLSNRNVIQLALGLNHVLFLTSDKEVYSYGTGLFGQLGHGESIRKLNEPRRIRELSMVDKITSGTYYSLALTKDGDLYRWGLYDARTPPVYRPRLEALPFKDSNTKITEIASQKEKTCIGLDNGEIYILNFHNPKINLLCKLSDTYPKKISIGANFGLVLDNCLQLFVWGDNTYNEFNYQGIMLYNAEYPNFYKLNTSSWGICNKLINNHESENINVQNNDLCDTNNNELGLNCNGSNNDYDGSLNDKVYIESVSCGDKHSLILTSNNTILCMGDNTYGQCGIGIDDKNYIYPPITMKKFNNLDLNKPFITCGSRSSAIISPNGKLFLCGQTFCESNKVNKRAGVSKYAEDSNDAENSHRISAEYSIINRNSTLVKFNDKGFIVVTN
ncbi:hypothetical protein FG386_002597 [Cryptosporidium ryanae]|uniref:uncharacterized protein n=1 Tax=Cryptosporidium ryanae TaxID=515981 RepID=UPI00351A2B1C|nr:hypothetical protein FG386_002597 [Cryptosporidium ryanae]